MVKAINNANQPSCRRAAVQAVSCIAGVQSSNRRGAVKAGALQVRPAGLAGLPEVKVQGSAEVSVKGWLHLLPRLCAGCPERCLLQFSRPGMPMYGVVHQFKAAFVPGTGCLITAVSDLTRLSLYLQALLELAPSIGDATESLGWALAFFAGDEKDAMSLLTLGGWLMTAGSHCVPSPE